MDAGALWAAWSFVARKNYNAGCGWHETDAPDTLLPLNWDGAPITVAGAYVRS